MERSSFGSYVHVFSSSFLEIRLQIKGQKYSTIHFYLLIYEIDQSQLIDWKFKLMIDLKMWSWFPMLL